MAIKTLKLDGDAGDDIATEVEAAFGIQFVDELVDVETVGDLHARLMSRLSRNQGGCATSMAFYRIRRALRAQGVADPIRPSTPIQLARRRPARFMRGLGIASGLRDLHAMAGLFGNVALWVGLAGLVAMIVSGSIRSWPVFAAGSALMLSAFAFARLDKGRLPQGVSTVGDLARYAVARNHGSLIVQGAAVRDREVWESLQRIVGDATGHDGTQIGVETRFFDLKPKRAA